LRPYNKAAAGEKAIKELDKSVKALEKAVSGLMGELKSQRADIQGVTTMVDKLARGVGLAVGRK
jgi:hypothetical protein